MRTICYFFLAGLVLLASCKKEEATSSRLLLGKWKLVSVTDKATGSVHFKPAGSSGDITLVFTKDGFSGKTLRNTLSSGEYTLQNGTDLMIVRFGMTYVNEDSWGSMFLTVLYACGLQSVMPCKPSTVSLTGAILKIESPLKYDLTLVRD